MYVHMYECMCFGPSKANKDTTKIFFFTKNSFNACKSNNFCLIDFEIPLLLFSMGIVSMDCTFTKGKEPSTSFFLKLESYFFFAETQNINPALFLFLFV